ncbi:MAG: hypothetical protein D6744_07580 [Planctomycetota bacterium]|nr:MAG: hypothetical protein D6744_07580 [Planctomycetota bacterium]
MFEVHTGSRPGRPRLLLSLCAAALLISLGLAWAQVRLRRTLGPETRIAGTPLIVRAPRGWRADPKTPGLFYQAVRVEGRFGPKLDIKRQIRFRYRLWRGMQPVEALLRRRNSGDHVATADSVERARIGVFDGLQVRRVREFELFGEYHREETLFRLAMSPRGDEIGIEYFPLRELTQGDLALFEEVCRSVRVEGVAFDDRGSQAAARAGLEFEIADDWRVFSAGIADVPGVYIQNSRRGAPIWGLSVFRTWLSPNRDALQLLADFAEENWSVSREQARIATTRVGQAAIAWITNPDPPADRAAISAARLVATDDTHAAIIFTLSDQRRFAAADQAAADLAATLRIRDGGFVEDIKAAREAGEILVRELSRGGVQRVWGQDTQTRYFARMIDPVLLIEDRRRPASVGYEGELTYTFAGVVEPVRHISWTVGPRAVGFSWELREQLGGGRALHVLDRRDAAGAGVVRTWFEPRGRPSVSYPVGPRFVAPPIEELVELSVSRRGGGWWEIEVLTRLSGGTHARLMRPLAGGAVLLIDDYDPRGAVVVFDESGKRYEQLAEVGRIERLDAPKAKALLRPRP